MCVIENMFRYPLVLCFTFFVQKVVAESCSTPRQQLGECISIKDCPSLFQILQKKPVSQENIQLLQKSQCGFEGNQPKVCCVLENKGTNNLLPGPNVCGLDPHERIVGGKLAGLKEFAWMALLEYDKPSGSGFHCGGSLINNRYVLTAAHCVSRVPKTWKLVGVRLGEHNLDTDPDCDNTTPGFEDCNDSPIDIPIEEVIVHEEYGSKTAHQANDIALLRLSRPVSFTESVGPICLPTSTARVNIRYVGTNMTVAGWGRTENSSQSNVKLKLEVPVKSNSECSVKYSKSGVTLQDGQLCAGGIKGEDSCTGDSGGPLMLLNRVSEYNWYLTAVVSFGPTPCGIKDFPGVYTKVEKYMPWIVSKLQS